MLFAQKDILSKQTCRLPLAHKARDLPDSLSWYDSMAIQKMYSMEKCKSSAGLVSDSDVKLRGP